MLSERVSALKYTVMAVENTTALIHLQSYYKPTVMFWPFLT
jgi:hypothetical protein